MFLTGTNIMSGRDAAVQSAAASAGSFFLPFFTKGLTCLIQGFDVDDVKDE
jgi:hypothetical protein